MTAPILVPLDGSPFAERALPRAISLARGAGAPLEVVSVVSPTIPPTFLEFLTPEERGQHDRAVQDAEQYLATVKGRIRATGGPEVSSTVMMGPIAPALFVHARDRGARLVVMTTRGRGALQRVWIGSVTDGLIRRAPPCPVLALPADDGGADGVVDLGDAPSFRKVLVPLDGSPAARVILDPLVELLGSEGVEYLLVRVIVPNFPFGAASPSGVGRIPGPEDEAMRDEAIQLLGERKAELEAQGVRSVDTRIISGARPPDALLALANEWGADLIAMTSAGRGGMERLLLGSTADKIIRGSSLPVMVARRSEES